jgi:vaccinia related kinase
MHFYQNCSKETEINAFIKRNNLSYLALAKYISTGVFESGENVYRFLTLEKYSSNLQKLIDSDQFNRLDHKLVINIASQILFALEYIHYKGYAHGDIKASNIMMNNLNNPVLLDFGMCYRFKKDNIHQKWNTDPKRKHNGTVEYASRDAHMGASNIFLKNLL